jgi:hypothetical protein
MVVLIVGLLGVFLALDSSSHLSSTAQRQQIAAAAAEQEMEKLRELSYANLKLSSAPVHQNDTSSDDNPSVPNYWVSSTAGYMTIPADFASKSGGLLGGALALNEPFVTGGTVSPSSLNLTTGGDASSPTYTYDVYRYVTSVNDCNVLSALLAALTIAGTCPTADGKRVTIALILHSGTGLGVQKPVWISTVVADPAAKLSVP